MFSDDTLTVQREHLPQRKLVVGSLVATSIALGGNCLLPLVLLVEIPVTDLPARLDGGLPEIFFRVDV